MSGAIDGESREKTSVCDANSKYSALHWAGMAAAALTTLPEHTISADVLMWLMLSRLPPLRLDHLDLGQPKQPDYFARLPVTETYSLLRSSSHRNKRAI